MAHSSRSAGKQTDSSTEWSEWIWSEEHGYSYSIRYGTDGQPEYIYDYPETPSEETPRYTEPVVDWSQEAGEYGNASPDPPGQYTTAAEKGSSNVGSSGWEESPDYGKGPSDSSSSHHGYTAKVSTSRSYKGPGTRHATDTGALVNQMGGASLEDLPENLPSKLPLVQVEAPGGQTKISRHINRDVSNKLDARFVVIDEKKHKKFWKPGRVFMMLWTEPAREGLGAHDSQYSTVWLEQKAYSEIRRFVVVGEGYGNVICSPIHSYGGQATLKPNLPEPEQHAMIYTSPNPPEEHCLYDSDGKVVAREALSKDPIRVRQELNDEQGDLGCFSRINYAKIYTVEKYVRILNIGKVHEDSMDSLIASCFFARPEDQPPKGPRRPSSSSKPKEGRERKEDKGSSSRHHRKHK